MTVEFKIVYKAGRADCDGGVTWFFVQLLLHFALKIAENNQLWHRKKKPVFNVWQDGCEILLYILEETQTFFANFSRKSLFKYNHEYQK